MVDGNTYTPVAAAGASAKQRKEGTQPQNFTMFGALVSSGAISFNDLRAGRYREAEVLTFVVDHRYPFAGKFITDHLIIRSTTWNGEEWSAECEGLLSKLKQTVGDVYTVGCGWKRFGDADCGFNKASTAVAATVQTIVESRRVFTIDITSKPDSHFNLGELTWTSGNNNGLISEVQGYEQGSFESTVYLYVDTPFDIQVGDTLSVERGCPRTEERCKEYGNFANYGGHPDLIGTDAALDTPEIGEDQ